MYLLLTLTLFCWIQKETAVEAIDILSIENDHKEYNISCYFENCKDRLSDSLSTYSCHCGIHCAQLGTCCLDSFYIGSEPPIVTPTCRPAYKGDSYFMVDHCASSNNAWGSLCNDEWNGDNDIQKLTPVTSQLSFITYKNYFCFRCYETHDEFLYWTVKLENEFLQSFDISDDDINFSLEYNVYFDNWNVFSSEGEISANLSLLYPNSMRQMIHVCEPDMISTCREEWTDMEIRDKCESYMAIKQVNRSDVIFNYKNIHCALCNFENLDDIACRKRAGYGYTTKTAFSFTHLLDINRSDGEKVGKIEKCEEGQMWDPYAKRCRQLTCALPGFQIKNGNCVQE